MGVKKIIGFDFDGAFIRSVAAKEAHAEWFVMLSVLLDDVSVKDLMHKKDWWPDVYKLMEQYTGLSHKDEFDKQVITKMARNLYQFSFLGAANRHKKNLLFKDVAALVKKLRPKYRAALITTTPEDIVQPILHLVGFKDFDFIQTVPLSESSAKLVALERFCKKHGRPALYVGNRLDDIRACKKLKIKSVLALWGDHDKEAAAEADFTAKNAAELKKIIDIL